MSCSIFDYVFDDDDLSPSNLISTWTGSQKSANEQPLRNLASEDLAIAHAKPATQQPRFELSFQSSKNGQSGTPYKPPALDQSSLRSNPQSNTYWNQSIATPVLNPPPLRPNSLNAHCNQPTSPALLITPPRESVHLTPQFRSNPQSNSNWKGQLASPRQSLASLEPVILPTHSNHPNSNSNGQPMKNWNINSTTVLNRTPLHEKAEASRGKPVKAQCKIEKPGTKINEMTSEANELLAGYSCKDCSNFVKRNGGSGQHCQLPNCCHIKLAHMTNKVHVCPDGNDDQHTMDACPANYAKNHKSDIKAAKAAQKEQAMVGSEAGFAKSFKLADAKARRSLIEERLNNRGKENDQPMNIKRQPELGLDDEIAMTQAHLDSLILCIL